MPEKTRTVSICVTEAEGERIAQRAATAGTSKSGWAVAAIMGSTTSAARRAAVQKRAREIEAADTPKGFRGSRVSAVITVDDHDALKGAAGSLGLAVHAYAQAVVIAAAEMDEPIVERPKQAAKAAPALDPSTVAIHIPASLKAADLDTLSSYVARLITATAVQILDGNGRKIAGGASRLVEEINKAPTKAVGLKVSRFELEAAAFVLGLKVDVYATALATRAARLMEAS